MAIGLADIYEKRGELVAITDGVGENTERIAKVEENVDTLHIDMVEMRGDIRAILSQLRTEERIDTLESIVKEHIAACERARA